MKAIVKSAMFCVVVALCCCSVAVATVVNINIGPDQGAPGAYITPYTGLGAAPDAGTYWNVAPGGTHAFPGHLSSTTSNLKASDGTTVTSMGLNLGQTYEYESRYNATGSFNNLLQGTYITAYIGDDWGAFSDYYADGKVDFEVTGLDPAKSYDIYVYAVQGDVTVGGVTKTLGLWKNEAGSTPVWVEDSHYAKYAGLTGLSSITGEVLCYSEPATYMGTSVQGMQIVEIPEPSTLALLAGALIGLLAYAWRKRK